MKLRIRKWRDRHGWSQEELAGRSGFAVSQISRWETGERTPGLNDIQILADALMVRPRDLLDDIARVPVVGAVGAGQQVLDADAYAQGEGRKNVPCPEDLDPRSTVSVVVIGDSMLPIGEGWLLFYSQHVGITEALGKLCIVKLADDGPRMVKRVRPGYEPGKFNLISSNASPIENVTLDWAAPVLDMKPPEWGLDDEGEPTADEPAGKRKRGRPRKSRVVSQKSSASAAPP